MFSDLFTSLHGLRLRTARFRRVALHLHSPDSPDWASGAADASRNARSRFDGTDGLNEFVQELRPHLDFVAVTDHMKCRFSSQLSRHVGSNDEFMTLPGMEVNFRLEPPFGFARIHLLVIIGIPGNPNPILRQPALAAE